MYRKNSADLTEEYDFNEIKDKQKLIGAQNIFI